MKVNNIIGVPIYQEAQSRCPYYREENSKKDMKFPVCVCPNSVYSVRSSNSIIVRCSKVLEECQMLSTQNKRDIALIEKYIEKYSCEEWLSISEGTWNKLKTMLSNENDYYLRALLGYFGYYLTKDQAVESAYLYCGQKLSEVNREG
jgi:hypothetical protein